MLIRKPYLTKLWISVPSFKSLIWSNNLTVSQYRTSHSLTIWWRISLVIQFQFDNHNTNLNGVIIILFPFRKLFRYLIIILQKGHYSNSKHMCNFSIPYYERPFVQFFQLENFVIPQCYVSVLKTPRVDSGARAKRKIPEKTQKKPITSNFNTIK